MSVGVDAGRHEGTAEHHQPSTSAAPAHSSPVRLMQGGKACWLFDVPHFDMSAYDSDEDSNVAELAPQCIVVSPCVTLEVPNGIGSDVPFTPTVNSPPPHPSPPDRHLDDEFWQSDYSMLTRIVGSRFDTAHADAHIRDKANSSDGESHGGVGGEVRGLAGGDNWPESERRSFRSSCPIGSMDVAEPAVEALPFGDTPRTPDRRVRVLHQPPQSLLDTPPKIRAPLADLQRLNGAAIAGVEAAVHAKGNPTVVPPEFIPAQLMPEFVSPEPVPDPAALAHAAHAHAAHAHAVQRNGEGPLGEGLHAAHAHAGLTRRAEQRRYFAQLVGEHAGLVLPERVQRSTGCEISDGADSCVVVACHAADHADVTAETAGTAGERVLPKQMREGYSESAEAEVLTVADDSDGESADQTDERKVLDRCVELAAAASEPHSPWFFLDKCLQDAGLSIWDMSTDTIAGYAWWQEHCPDEFANKPSDTSSDTSDAQSDGVDAQSDAQSSDTSDAQSDAQSSDTSDALSDGASDRVELLRLALLRMSYGLPAFRM